jgi:hypothetical protein
MPCVSISRLRIALFSLLGIFLAGCAAPSPAQPQAQLNLYASSAAGPWLSEAFACAAGQNVLLNLVASPEQAGLVLRVGEPPALISPSFQIDTEEILVVANRQSPLQNLALDEARQLFAGRGDPAAELWVYSPGEDTQQVFDRLVMGGAVVSSLARLAVSPQNMSDSLNSGTKAVGILPRHWKAGDLREVFSAGNVPVLAITPQQPEGALWDLIACLQK